MKKSKLTQITAQELKRRTWIVYGPRGERQLRISSVTENGEISGKLADRQVRGGIDWRTSAIIFRQDYPDPRYVRVHRGFVFLMKRAEEERWVMSGTFLTLEPECAQPWRQEFGWFAEQG